MTDNEKAATFIGWSPYTCDDGHCDFCGSRAFPHHPAQAPDMSDPRNYMKALENLGRDLSIAYRHESGIVQLTSWFCDIAYQSSAFNEINAIGKSPSEAVTKALAALYDTESPALERSISRGGR